MTEAGARDRSHWRFILFPFLVAALLSAIYADRRIQHHYALLGVVAAIGVLGLWELHHMARIRGDRVAWVPAALCYLGMAYFSPWGQSALRASVDVEPSPFLHWAGLLASFAGLLAIACFFWTVARPDEFRIKDAALTIGAFVYLSPLLCVAFLGGGPGSAIGYAAGETLLLFVLVTTKGCDTAAFVGGKLFGKTKMVPKISPGKTWVGAVAGTAAGSVAGLWFLLELYWHSQGAGPAGWRTAALILIAVGATILGQLGDLSESAIKRWAGVKDSNPYIPEFGALDMVDSFLMTTPLMLWLAGHPLSPARDWLVTPF